MAYYNGKKLIGFKCSDVTELIKKVDDLEGQVSELQEQVEGAFEAGKIQQDYDWWNTYQNENQGGMNWATAMFAGQHWTDKTFKPKFDICPTEIAQYMFMFNAVQDLDTAIKNAGITMDLSNCKNVQSLFQNYTGKIIPEINILSTTNLTYLFGYCVTLTTIKGLGLRNEGDQSFTSSFTQCTSLKDLTITSGLIGRSIDLKNSPLTLESAISVINHLKDYHESNTGKYTISFSSTTWELLDEAGWIFTLPNGDDCDARDYISYLGWNC